MPVLPGQRVSSFRAIFDVMQDRHPAALVKQRGRIARVPDKDFQRRLAGIATTPQRGLWATMGHKSKRGAILPRSITVSVISRPHIEELLDCDGHITVGRISPVPYAAVASDEYNMLAALVRRKGESLLEFLERLDQAIDHAMNDDIFIDEINS